MVSWGDGDESSEGLSSVGIDSINTIYDSEFCGLADDGDAPVYCKCYPLAARFVAFDGCVIDRRFFACQGQDNETYDFVQWVDDVWPEAPQKSLLKLWKMHEEVKQGRVTDALDNLEAKFKFRDEITKLHLDLMNAQDELKREVEEKQMTLALKAKAKQALIEARDELEQKKILDASTYNMHKFLMMKAEKERDKYKEEKRKLEFMIADLLKQKEGTRAKIQKIKNILDE